MLLSFGPLLLLGLCGTATVVYLRRWEALPAIVLAVVAVGFYFFTDVPDMQHVWVGWRAGHAFFIALTVLTAIFLTRLTEMSGAVATVGWVLTIALAVGAAPTVAMDVFNAQDITNAGVGPSFPWTLHLTAGEVEAFDWLRTHTPLDVVVQPDSLVRGSASWGYITGFGERRMAAGLPIAMVPLQPYQDMTQRVSDAVFERGSAVERAQAAHGFGIDYLWLGPAEQQKHPDMVAVLDSRTDLFAPVFRNKDVVIYWVTSSDAR
jgi:uncharacterized membrane protein